MYLLYKNLGPHWGNTDEEERWSDTFPLLGLELWGWVDDWALMCLLCKQEDLCPQDPFTCLVGVGLACNYSLRKKRGCAGLPVFLASAGRDGGIFWSKLAVEKSRSQSWIMRDPASMKNMEKQWNLILNVKLGPPHACQHMWARCEQMWTHTSQTHAWYRWTHIIVTWP